jgi:hypothetical protein
MIIWFVKAVSDSFVIRVGHYNVANPGLVTVHTHAWGVAIGPFWGDEEAAHHHLRRRRRQTRPVIVAHRHHHHLHHHHHRLPNYIFVCMMFAKKAQDGHELLLLLFVGFSLSVVFGNDAKPASRAATARLFALSSYRTKMTCDGSILSSKMKFVCRPRF